MIATTPALALMQGPLRFLVLGAGGKEYANAHHLLAATIVERIFVAPGNGGTATLNLKRCQNISVSACVDVRWDQIVQWSKENGITLVVPGPEQLLVDGAEKAFRDGECWQLASEVASRE